MTETDSHAFEYDGGRVDPGETRHFKYTVSETYLGDPIRVPVSVVNGDEPGKTAFLSAAIHGDELNGVETVRTIAHEWDHDDVRGTLVCLPVLNVPGFLFQQRYLPIYDRDLNRAFPGSDHGTSAKRIAQTIYRNFVEPCDFGVDLHTSTRGRTNLFHVRAEMDDEAVARLARGFGSRVVIDSAGPFGSLRREATARGTPTITVEMGQAHRFQREMIDRALAGVRSVFAEYGLHPQETVRWPGWRTVISGDEKTWLRADAGGLVEMHHDRGDLVYEGESICTVTSPFLTESTVVDAPFTGIVVGVLENPVVYPGNPLCHFVEVDRDVQRIIESEEAAEDAPGDA
ncbi:MAG: succinylglutamate desuccinylase/aspartoacylase family protein [Haloferacaceae archaeon]